MIIRFASADDASSLLKIYMQYINTPITFECSLPEPEDFKHRISHISKFYPYLICEDNAKAIAYAYAHRHMEREAYQWNAELSVYIDQSYTSAGLGKKLYCLLIEILKLQGIRNVYGCVTLPNLKSEKLHASLGFQLMGIYHAAGYKTGTWHDVAWYEKNIAPYDLIPAPIQPVSSISPEQIAAIIQSP